MKTIAISIDEASLSAVDRIARAAGRGRGGKRTPNRSEVIRLAVREFLLQQNRREREEGDRQVLATNRDRLEREARLLVAEQARP